MMFSCQRLLPFFAGLLLAFSLQAAPEPPMVSATPSPGSFTLFRGGEAASLVVGSADFPGVRRVAAHLQQDIERVSGIRPDLLTDQLPAGKPIVLIGTVGKNPLLDRLVAEKKLDLSEIAGKWETFRISIVENPFPGIPRALVIAGSDKRATIFGMYHLSENIGVSPWYWWADVPVRRAAELYVSPGPHSAGTPKIKYRGIFINDEAPALAGWATEKFGGFNARFYEHVFELILRLKGNFLWPAMWGNMFYVDDPENPRLANEYGVVVSTSHHEPMMRAHAEWAQFGEGPWNYDSNPARLRAFWQEGIERMGDYESIVTLAMRGDGDEPMSEEANIALLQKIVADQRRILSEVTGKSPAEIPQVWALYKEVQEYYDRGMRVPEDVTLLLCDDNWGNIRKLPQPGEAARPGGYGIYYHYDYVGGPRNYKWLNTNQISRVWEQMHLAYQYNARQIWIVNVGDIKPMEFPISFFLDYAWDPEAWPAQRLPEYTGKWAAQQFGEEHAAEIAHLLTEYTRFNSRRKPELLAPDTYSLIHFREAERVVAEYADLEEKARRIATTLPADMQDAYYQLVLHPVEACANLGRMYYAAGLNHLYADQGNAAANDMAEEVRRTFARDSAITAYYHNRVAGGKWHHMMSQTHIGYTYWQQPDKNAMPEVQTLDLPDRAEMGINVEGSEAWWPAQQTGLSLPALDNSGDSFRYLDIFNRGTAPFAYRISADQPWITVDAANGEVDRQTRVRIGADWQRLSPGQYTGQLTVSGPDGQNARITVSARVFDKDDPDLQGRFVENNGYIAMEAAHFSRATTHNGIGWQVIPNLGRTLSSVTPVPVTAPVQTLTGEAPQLAYDLFFTSAGEVTVQVYLSPTLNFHNNQGLRFALSFDEQPPQVLNMHEGRTFQDWEESVRNNVTVVSAKLKIAGPGPHTLNFRMIDPGVTFQKIVIKTGTVGESYLGPPESGRITARRDPTATVQRTFTNPILAGFYPDPSICRVGEDFYLVNSTFAWFPGIPVFHSRDLVNWNLLGHVMDRPEQLNTNGMGVSRGLFAPAISHHEGLFYLTCTLVDGGGNFVVTAENPAGPWSDPHWLPEVNGIDPSLFFDENGQAYIVYNSDAPDNKPLYPGHRSVRMFEFDYRNLRVVGEEKLLVNGGVDITQNPVWIEGPHLYRINDFYYLMAAEGGTAEDHREVIFRSKSVAGPYLPWAGNPILTQRHLPAKRSHAITSTGHADLVQTPNGDWWAVFLGIRPYPPEEQHRYNTGRETFLAPVRWTGDGWPVINPDFEEVQYRYPMPVMPADPPGPIPYSGNFTYRDEFEGAELGPNWQFLRTPLQKWYALEAGVLRISLRPESCAGSGNPALVARRQQHLVGAVSTSMQFQPAADNEKAGLLAFQNEGRYYVFCRGLQEGKPVVQLLRSVDSPDSRKSEEVLASQVLPPDWQGEALLLKIEFKNAHYRFSYGMEGQDWQILADSVDAAYIRGNIPRDFTGVMLGMYATSSGKPSQNAARFSWFEYRGNDEVYQP